MYKKFCYLFTVIILLSACSPVRKIFESGKLQQTSFVEKIPFTFNYGIPFIQVNINGKNYNFMFDTGAPNIISPELAQSLNLISKTTQSVSDSQGSSNKEQYVIVPSIQIGNLNFQNTGAVVIAPSTVFEFKCMKYDGIIGANLMAKAIWKIDYQNKILTITDDLAKLNVSTAAKMIPFIPQNGQKTPLVPVTIGNKTYYATFDTGFNGDFSLAIRPYKTEISDFKFVQSSGNMALGIYGGGTDVYTKHIKVPTLNMGQVSLESQILDFSEGSSNLIGNMFFKNYSVILNWNENKIYMIKETEYDATRLETFGFSLKYVNNKPKVAKIYQNSEAERLGIQINDQLIRVNDKDVTNLSDEEACFYAFNSILKTPGSSVDLVIQRANQKIKLTLNKSTLLE